ncbi:DUF2000 domain-containing protein [Patescibacteria group bacterium]|nr:DUF2000 domain-containing protein [Patescibacteria group bacterium]MCL5797706.1 DUF2000 domain-containing protein [Patescibacteria group bacterium]
MKSAIIINPDLPLGFLANAVACISSGIFNNGNELVGPEIKGKDVNYIPITKIPILILKPGNKTLLELCRQAQNLNLKYMAFTKEAQSTTNYGTYIKSVSGFPLESVTLLGLGVVGPDEIVNSLVGNLPMLR